MAAPEPLGFFGKLPSHGDFVRRRVPPAFLGAWDPWLQQVISASREWLGEQWLQTYLTSPVWRFVLGPGVCGAPGFAGLLMPSVDAVGRYFPLTLVTPLPGPVSLTNLAVEEADWYGRLEQLALSVLEPESPFDLEEFDRRVEALGSEFAPRTLSATVPEPALQPGQAAAGVQVGMASLAEMPFAMLAALGAELAAAFSPLSLWWSEGSERVAPCWFAGTGLPAPHAFTAALDGAWSGHGWTSRALRWAEPAPLATVPDPLMPLRFRSAARTDVGNVRKVNEDACLARPEAGLWAVADGVGGQAAGDEASRMLADALNAVDADGDLQDRINRVREAVDDVHQRLLHLSRRPVDPVDSASTVAVLVGSAAGCAFLWAGDSRIYRFRNATLVRCTKDHSLVQGLLDAGSLAPEQAEGHPQSNVITQAVGSGDRLELECGHGELLPGDRYLLCTDGLHGQLRDAELEAVLAEGDCRQACDRLMDLALSREARDNVTAVVVDVLAPGPAGEDSPWTP